MPAGVSYGKINVLAMGLIRGGWLTNCSSRIGGFSRGSVPRFMIDNLKCM